MQKFSWELENTEHVVVMLPQPVHEIKLFMSHAKICEEHNDIVSKSPRNCNLSANCCMPFVGSLNVEKVMHTVTSNPFSNVDKQIITQRIDSLLEKVWLCKKNLVKLFFTKRINEDEKVIETCKRSGDYL